MALLDEFRGSTDRFKARVDDLQQLLRAHGVDGIRPLVRAYRENDNFRSRWHDIWLAAARDDGGKLSLAAAGSILGAVLGGVGIAALGTAFGLPLLAVLGLGGLAAGIEVDAAVRRHWGDLKSIDVPKDVYERLIAKAKDLGVEHQHLAAELLRSSLD